MRVINREEKRKGGRDREGEKEEREKWGKRVVHVYIHTCFDKHYNTIYHSESVYAL